MPQQDAQISPSLVEENRRLKRAVEELSILNDLARAIGASVNSQEIMQTIIHRSLRAVQAEQGVITLVDKEAAQTLKTLVRSMVSSGGQQQFHFHQSLLGWMHLNKKPLMVNDPQHDPRFQGAKFDQSIRSILAAPMMIKSELKGVLTVYNKKESGEFTEENQRLLAIIAAQSAQVVENARLYEEEAALIRMQEEVRMASMIQFELLPKAPPKVPGYDIAGTTVPAQMVGGDYFDFIQVADQRLAVCVGDVSGKGMPASLLMANLQATLRGLSMLDIPVRECIDRANKLMYNSTGADKFVTLFYAIIDSKAHKFEFCNAGHNYPIVLTAQGEIRRLEKGGIVLGIMERFPFEDDAIQLNPRDTVVIFSDGITEALNAAGEQFEEDRLIALVREHHRQDAAEMVASIVDAVRRYAIDTPQADDMTLLVVKRSA